jgi:plasmid maintenance system antidote protein VapI
VNFHNLESLLVNELQERVRSGALTERHLAKLTGLSQPHVHNVLKGKRSFSPETADRIMASLSLDVLDLIDSAQRRR